MEQQESIYNIIPKSKRIPGKDALFKSQFPYWMTPTGSTFILKNTSFPGVANLILFLKEDILSLKNQPHLVGLKEDTELILIIIIKRVNDIKYYLHLKRYMIGMKLENLLYLNEMIDL